MSSQFCHIAMLFASGAASLQAGKPEDAAYFKSDIRPLLSLYCVECHKPGKEVDFLAVKDLSQIHSQRGNLRSAVEQLRNRTMPPPKEDQPSEGERRLLADWLERTLRETAHEMGPYAGTVTARRLNRLEYDNTIRDLLGLKFKFSQTFPSDGGGGEGFDNNGETLFLPVILMERYLDAAEAILDESIIVPETRRKFTPADFEKTTAKATTGHLAKGVEASVYFPVTMTAPHILTIRAKASGTIPAKLSLKVDGITAQSFEVPLGAEKSTELQLQFFRGPHRLTIVAETGEVYISTLELIDKPKAVTAERNEAHRRLLGDVKSSTLTNKSAAERRLAASALLQKFARLAYRMPVTETDIAKPLALFDRSAARNENFETSMKLAFRGILSSPRFLFRTEIDHIEPGIRPITQHELATRLSYFLWNSTPDDELNKLADSSKLNTPATLTAQLKRMLASPKADSFIQNFTEQWLGTKAVGETVPLAPESQDIKGIYNKDIGADMRKEAIAMIDHLIRGDRSLLELISADYSFINGRLADYYGIQGVKGKEFRKITLKDNLRGGVLGLGAVQMLTSPGKRTSPVLRGAWVLTTLMGTPVPAPPPDVPALESASTKQRNSSSLSLREKLEIHRSDATCASCHNVIDPIGFSLEHFDRIGRWRDVDEKGKRIDASGQLASGQAFKDIHQFKAILLTRKRDFARQMTSKLLGYSLGRSLVDRDDGTIEEIVDKLVASDFKAQTLLNEIILSTPFRNRNELTLSAHKSKKSPKPDKESE